MQLAKIPNQIRTVSWVGRTASEGRLEINYETKELRDAFQFPAKALARYGPRVAKALAVRFADLRALPNAAELAAFDSHLITVDGVPAFAVHLAEDYTIIIVPNHPKLRYSSESIVWSSVKRIRVLEIVRQHEPR